MTVSAITSRVVVRERVKRMSKRLWERSRDCA